MLLQTSALPTASRPAIVVIAIAYFAIVAGIGTWAARRTRTAGDFYIAGRRIGVWTLALASMAATVSGFAFIGGPGFVYAAGMGAMYLVLSASITSSMTAWVLGKRLRVLGEVRGLLTIPDAIRVRYRSPLAQGLAAVSIVVAVIGYMATNVLALGLVIAAVFDVGLGTGIWIGTAITVAYSVAGGILAGVYADVFQGSLMVIASVLVLVYAIQVGGAGAGLSGISETIRASDPEFFAPWGRMSPLAAMSLFFVFGMGSLAQPHVVHKFYMLRDAKRLKWYPMLMSAALIMTLLLYFAVGVAMKALVVRGEIAPLARPDDATPVFLLRFAPTALAALVFSGVAAAIMSTVNSFLSVGAAALTHDLPNAIGARVRHDLRWGRIATIGISVLAAGLAQYSGVVVAFLGIFGWGLFASTLVPALAIGLSWQGATREGAVASIATGLVTTLTLETLAYFDLYSFPTGVSVAGLALVLSFLVFFVVSWMTRHGPGARIDADVRAVMEI